MLVYSRLAPGGENAAKEERLIIRPQPRSRIPGNTRWQSSVKVVIMSWISAATRFNLSDLDEKDGPQNVA